MKTVAFNGLKWSSIQQVGFQVLNYTSIIALVYWVDPEIHGLFAIAALAPGLAGVLGAMGLSEIIIKDVDTDFQEKIPTYWSLVLVVACVLYLLSCSFSLIVAWFYKDEFSFQEIFNTSLILSCIAPTGPLKAMMEALHSRKYDFKRISLLNLSSFFIGIIPVFIFGYLGYDRLAIGGKFLLPHLSYLVLGVFFYKLDFGLRWDRSILNKIKNFSTFYSLNNIINYFLRNIDYIIIAKFFNSSVLGQYVIAYKILLFPMKNVTSTITRVGMPILSKLDSAGKEFKRRYFSMLEGISMITFPIMIFLAFHSELIVSITFSEKYDLLPMMISTLSIVGAIQSTVSPVGMLFIFKERMQLMMFTNIISFTLVALAILLASSFSESIFIVMLTYALTYVLLVMPISTLFIYKNYNFKFMDSFKAFNPYLLGVMLSVIVPYILVLETRHMLNDGVRLVLSFLIFGGSYLVFLVLLDRSKFGPRFFHYYLIKLKLVR